ncbi:hypothetical protein DI005_13605 [Prauserella sp. PE36]|uniref:DUF6801 domain-containing protein n=1 Tax=Prauserella sp. PE36 TaxID=1504709 RepID=UPI000DE1D817|nr:DUF6801 domain-containing protein [Prauserella sp. PE36]RBM19897.1 hypothetical protein DI005_13605 [Prauserella sp. PE36]
MLHNLRRGSRKIAVAAALLLLAAGLNGGLAGAGPAPARQPERLVKDLGYNCAFPEPVGSRPLTMSISTRPLPESVAVGDPVPLEPFEAALTLQEETWRALAPLGEPTAIGGTVVVTLTVTEGATATPVQVELTLPDTPLPEAGPVTLADSAPVPPVATTTAGVALAIYAEAPLPTLTPKLADGTPSTDAPLRPTCSPEPGQEPLLGEILVVPPGSAEAPDGEGPADPGDHGDPAGPEARRQAQAAEAGLPGIAGGVDEPAPAVLIAPQFILGESTIAKLNTAFDLGPGMMVNGGQFLPPPTVTGNVALPPASTPFNAFGFMPTTGKAEFLPAEDAGGSILSVSGPNPASTLDAHSEVILRISEVLVNGVPLDVGPHCRTESPVVIDMVGSYIITSGGTVGTDPDAPEERHRGFTIPPFTGCGVTESLDPLVTGLVSGPGNQATMTLTTVR